MHHACLDDLLGVTASGRTWRSHSWLSVVCVRPVLCNNQKKVWKLQGNLHHDTSLFQGRAWLQVRRRRRRRPADVDDHCLTSAALTTQDSVDQALLVCV